MYCQRCGRVLKYWEQRIGYCHDCDVPHLLEEIRDGIYAPKAKPGVRIFIDGIEQYPNYILPAPKMFIDGIEYFPPSVLKPTNYCSCTAGCIN
jgi:hypothetical protein